MPSSERSEKGPSMAIDVPDHRTPHRSRRARLSAPSLRTNIWWRKHVSPAAAPSPLEISQAERLRDLNAPSHVLNAAAVEETLGKASWEYWFLMKQSTYTYTFAFILLLLLDVCASISGLLLSVSFPECSVIVAAATCAIDSSSWIATTSCGTLDEIEDTLALGCRPTPSTIGLVRQAIAIFSICGPSVFFIEALIHLAALRKCFGKTYRRFRFLMMLDLMILAFALGLEVYLLSVAYPSQSDLRLQNSTQVVVLVLRGYRYLQLAWRSYTIIRRAARVRSSRTGGNRDARDIEYALAQHCLRREVLGEKGGREDLVLHLCADLLHSMRPKGDQLQRFDKMMLWAQRARVKPLDPVRILKLQMQRFGLEDVSYDRSLLDTLNGLVSLKDSVLMWPDSLDKLEEQRKHNPGEVLRCDLDQLGRGAFAPLALVILADKMITRLKVECSNKDVWEHAAVVDFFIYAIARKASLCHLDFSKSCLPALRCQQLCWKLAHRPDDAEPPCKGIDVDLPNRQRDVRFEINDGLAIANKATESITIATETIAESFQMLRSGVFRARMTATADHSTSSPAEPRRSSSDPVRLQQQSTAEVLDDESSRSRVRDPCVVKDLSLVDNPLRGSGKMLALLVEHCSSLRRLDLSGTELSESDGNCILNTAKYRSEMYPMQEKNCFLSDEGMPARRASTPHHDRRRISGVSKYIDVHTCISQPCFEKCFEECVILLDKVAVAPERLHNLPRAVVAAEGDRVLRIDDFERLLEGMPKAMGDERFYGDAKLLRTGTQNDTTRGLLEYLGLSEEDEKEADRLGTEAIIKEVEALGDSEAMDELNYILYHPASEKQYPNGIRDKDRSGERLADFCRHPNAREAGLREQHVVALRLYTTKVFKHINEPLRRPCGKSKLAVTTYFICMAMIQMRRLYKLHRDERLPKVLWRGMRNLIVGDDFTRNKNGGAELAFMSTSTSLSIATSYGVGTTDPGSTLASTLIFRIDGVSANNAPASLSWLSAFPTEEEYLFPPLTYLSPTGRRQTFHIGRFAFEVIEVKVELAHIKS